MLFLISMVSTFYSQPKAEWSVRLGVVRLSSTSPWEQERRIVGMIKSPVEGTTVLVKLDRPVTTFSDFVRPVCLPSSEDPPSNTSQCNTLGWARNRMYTIIASYVHKWFIIAFQNLESLFLKIAIFFYFKTLLNIKE